MDSNDQSGFGTLGIVIAVFVALLAMGVGFFMLDKHHTSKTSNTSTQSSSSAVNSTGISGTVTNGGCPGAQSTTRPNNCYRSPEPDMSVTAMNKANDSTASAITNTHGYYHISVGAGTYSVSAHPTKSNVIAECQDATAVIVNTGKETQQNFDCNNGLE